MSGFWPQSFSQMNDLNGKPIVNAKAYFYAASTTTPIAVYADYDLQVPHPNPLGTDGYGRFPAVFLDEEDEFYRVRVTTAGGVILYDSDSIPIIGPSSGGGGGGGTPVDPNALLKTGDLKARYGEGFLAGYVRGNGRSIGTATSGATERANSDCQTLYEFLWNADPDLEVAGGRGSSANADWTANKPLTLPDFRGRAIVGLDDMGNIAANILTGATDLGWTGGEETVTLTVDQMPAHNHSVTINNAGAHRHQYAQATSGGGNAAQTGPASGNYNQTETAGDHNHTATIGSRGGGAAHPNVQPSLAITVYIRL
ncbi:MAG: hypothetical protein QHC90_13155 [Shinella sp.]|nr:hypothetical protein [Shinella sp.]